MGIGTKIAEKFVDHAAKSMGNGVANAAERAKTKLHRKYVWNDFSVGLEKAKIKILQCKDLIAQDLTTAEFEEICELYVQINPSSFSSSYAMSTRSILSTLEIKGDKEQPTPSFTFDSGSLNSSLDIKLDYDIYDEFMARTGNESYPTDSFSLVDDKVTSLPMLTKYANGIYYAQLIWGDIKKFGLIRGVDVEYTAFSRWGQPLKAIATLRITEQPTDAAGKIPKITNESLSSAADTAKKVAGNVAAGIKNIFR